MICVMRVITILAIILMENNCQNVLEIYVVGEFLLGGKFLIRWDYWVKLTHSVAKNRVAKDRGGKRPGWQMTGWQMTGWQMTGVANDRGGK